MSATEQSISDKIAAKFGLGDEAPPEQEESEAPAAVSEDTEAAPEAETPEPDVAEVEYEGKTYQVPPELKEAIITKGDYTQKTQELANQRRIVEAQQEALKSAALEKQFHESVKDEISQLQSLDANLKLYDQLNWRDMSSEDLMRHKFELDNLKEKRQELVNSVNGKYGQFTQTMKAHEQEVIKKGEEVLAKAIPKWGNETKKAIVDYALKQGYTQQELNAMVDPRVAITLWKAQQFDQLKTTAQKAPVKTTPVVKPGAVNTMSDADKGRLAFQKQMKSAKTSQDKAKAIEAELMNRFR